MGAMRAGIIIFIGPKVPSICPSAEVGNTSFASATLTSRCRAGGLSPGYVQCTEASQTSCTARRWSREDPGLRRSPPSKGQYAHCSEVRGACVRWRFFAFSRPGSHKYRKESQCVSASSCVPVNPCPLALQKETHACVLARPGFTYLRLDALHCRRRKIADACKRLGNNTDKAFAEALHSSDKAALLPLLNTSMETS